MKYCIQIPENVLRREVYNWSKLTREEKDEQFAIFVKELSVAIKDKVPEGREPCSIVNGKFDGINIFKVPENMDINQNLYIVTPRG